MASSSSSPSNPASPQPPPLLLPPPEPASTPTPPPPLPEARSRPRPRPTVADGVRGLLRSGEALIRAVFFSGNSGHQPPPRLPVKHQQHHLHHQQPQQPQHRPGDIMKRLQRETFPDVMKFMDKHDQIEHIISLYKTVKGLESLELPIHVKIALDVVGALFLVDGTEFEQAKATLDKVGRRTGLGSRFVFESKIRGKDTIAAELSTQLGAGGHLGRSVELTRLQYNARINEWLSMILVPFGARCNNFLHNSSMIQNLQSQASFDGPPSFLEHHNCGAGLRIEGSKFTASFAELIFGSGVVDSGVGGTNRMTTIGQVSCKPANDVKLSLSGIWQVPSLSPQFNNLSILAIPLGNLKPEKPTTSVTEHTELTVKFNNQTGVNTTSQTLVAVQGASPAVQLPHSMALLVDCELYETLKTEGWFQMERSNHGPVCWGFTLSDIPDNELGWGVKVSGGAAEEKRRKNELQHLELEGFLNFNLGKGARLQPGLVYAKMEGKMTPALFLRSSWVM